MQVCTRVVGHLPSRRAKEVSGEPQSTGEAYFSVAISGGGGKNNMRCKRRRIAARDGSKSSFPVKRPRTRSRVNGRELVRSGDGATRTSARGPSALLVDALPNHIVSDVLFRYLDQSPKQLLILRSVCRLFRTMSRSSFRTLHMKPNVVANNVAISQFRNLNEVDFSFCANFDDRELETLAPMRDKLRVLKLRGTQVSDRGVMSFFEHSKCMKWSESSETVMPATAKHKIDPRPSLPLQVLDLSETKRSLQNKAVRISNKSVCDSAS
ncbi:hypothetical protein ACHAWF_018498 [Thalassiosira exigua]